jgi:hypothetical protein
MEGTPTKSMSWLHMMLVEQCTKKVQNRCPQVYIFKSQAQHQQVLEQVRRAMPKTIIAMRSLEGVKLMHQTSIPRSLHPHQPNRGQRQIRQR